MMDAETKTQPRQPAARRPVPRRSPQPPWMEATLADWRERWPAAFTKPVPLAVGISGQMEAVLRANGTALDLKTFGMTIHSWTMQGAYLHAVMRGETRRNLDGSEAGVPDDEARQQAKKLLDERAARRAERER
jgi:sRNA-binding protein